MEIVLDREFTKVKLIAEFESLEGKITKEFKVNTKRRNNKK